MTIQTLLSDHGLTQTGLSKRFGIPLRTVQDWCAGRRTPPPYVITLLQIALEAQKEDA
jgi:DNA-binding transcriptional regulator YiaG